jgi:hypothetical protein
MPPVSDFAGNERVALFFPFGSFTTAERLMIVRLACPLP